MARNIGLDMVNAKALLGGIAFVVYNGNALTILTGIAKILVDIPNIGSLDLDTEAKDAAEVFGIVQVQLVESTGFKVCR
jgi:hypothetical protein